MEFRKKRASKKISDYSCSVACAISNSLQEQNVPFSCSIPALTSSLAVEVVISGIEVKIVVDLFLEYVNIVKKDILSSMGKKDE